MEITEEARTISRKILNEVGLLYQSAMEIQKAINEKRTVILYRNDQIAAFCIWTFYGDWCEIASLYVEEKFRNLPYLQKIISSIKNRLEPMAKNIFFFTRHPVIVRIAQGADFIKVPYWKLPTKVWIKILIHRLHPIRIISYLKFLKLGLKIFQLNFSLYIFKKPAV